MVFTRSAKSSAVPMPASRQFDDEECKRDYDSEATQRCTPPDDPCMPAREEAREEIDAGPRPKTTVATSPDLKRARHSRLSYSSRVDLLESEKYELRVELSRANDTITGQINRIIELEKACSRLEEVKAYTESKITALEASSNRDKNEISELIKVNENRRGPCG